MASPGAERVCRPTKTWQDTYALRAGVEGTIHQAIAITGIRHARYRGLPKTSLQHAFSAVALNLIRLDAWWNGHPRPNPNQPRRRTVA